MGSEGNKWITTMMGTPAKNTEMPQPTLNAPGMFRCAKPGMIKQFFEQAGFTNVQEQTITGKIDSVDAATYWENMTEVAAPVVSALSKADEAAKQKIQDEVYEACNNQLSDGKVVMDFAAIIISSEK